MITSKYRAQADLLLRIVPYVAKEEIFALKGGSAINLFVRDMPRLSVDLDLTYLPLDTRNTALKNIHEALANIKNDLQMAIKGITVQAVAAHSETDVKLNCQFKDAQIKIEVNTITRGHIFPVRLKPLTDKVQREFGKFAAINIVSHAELYGGKICAALDRQHPRDLFDVQILFDNEGFSDEVRLGLIVSLLSHYKPVYELLNPVLKEQKPAFERQFSGMSALAFNYDNYEFTRSRLIDETNKWLTKENKELIFSFENGAPDWELFPYKIIKELPAVQWKLLNIRKLRKENLKKHKKLMDALEKVLYA